MFIQFNDTVKSWRSYWTCPPKMADSQSEIVTPAREPDRHLNYGGPFGKM